MARRSTAARTADDTGLRKTLIGAARTILANQGIEALTLRATARAAGVSHMAPYRHFDDKETLLAAVAEKGFRALTAAMDHTMAEQNSPESRLRAIGVAYVVFACRHRELYRLMFRAGIREKSRFPELVEAGESAYSRCLDAVAACGIGDKNPDSEALVHRSLGIWALVHGLASLMIDEKIAVPEQDPAAMERMIEAILTSL